MACNFAKGNSFPCIFQNFKKEPLSLGTPLAFEKIFSYKEGSSL